MAKLTVSEREQAASILASTHCSTAWEHLRPFTRAMYRTRILTMERIFIALDAHRAALAKEPRT